MSGSSTRNDVEKNWHDPPAFRAAVTYDAVVIAVAAVAFAIYAVSGDLFTAALVPAFLFLGGVGAFVQTYRVWKAEGTWPIWHGAGWFLFALFLVGLSVPATVG
jgi:hypothetical protein